MKCYRQGGCGPYEMNSCSECPASKVEYITDPLSKQIVINLISEDLIEEDDEVMIKCMDIIKMNLNRILR